MKPATWTICSLISHMNKVLNKKAKILKIPSWINNLTLFHMRIFTSVKMYGPVEFMMTIMTMDVVGEQYGKEKLGDFFKKNT